MRWYRFAVVEVAQSYPGGAASVRSTQVPLGKLDPSVVSGTQ